MSIVTRAEWGFQGPLGPRQTPSRVRGAWLHHSVTVATSNPHADMRTLERIGKSRFGRLSYSWGIHPSGVILQGQDGHIGAHTGGQNSTSEGICCIGNWHANRPPQAMLDAIAWLLRRQFDRGVWPRIDLLGGHRDAPNASTACPGQFLYPQIAAINAAARSGGIIVPSDPASPPQEINDMYCKFGDGPGDPNVEALQHQLRYIFGINIGSSGSRNDGVDGHYGSKTAEGLSAAIGNNNPTSNFGSISYARLEAAKIALGGGGGGGGLTQTAADARYAQLGHKHSASVSLT